MKTIAFFNNKGGVGKTTLVFHLAYMLRDLGHSVLAVDLDPQANLSAEFLDEEVFMARGDGDNHHTIYSAVEPILEGTGDIRKIEPFCIENGLHLIGGDLSLSLFEDELSSSWPGSLDRKPAALRATTAIARVIHDVAQSVSADYVLLDLGPSLGALNRSALIAADCVVIPVSPDLFSLIGMENVGARLNQWRQEWTMRRQAATGSNFLIPQGDMKPAGYVVMRHSIRLDRPVLAFQRWIDRFPFAYRQNVLGNKNDNWTGTGDDPFRLGLLKNYASLTAFAHDARKPMFRLKPGDGAIGNHMKNVMACRDDFKNLAERLIAAVKS